MSKENTSKGLDALQLQAYHDGELASSEMRAIEASLEPTDQLRLDALSEMSELVRFEHEQRVEDIEFDGLWARIETRLDEETAHTPAAVVATPVKGAGWFDRMYDSVVQFFSANKPILVPAFAAMAIAALVLIPMMLNEKADAPNVDEVVADGSETPMDTEAAPVEHELVEHKIVEQPTLIIVQQPDFKGNSMGTVQYSPNKIPVIWYLGADGSAAPAHPGQAGETPPWVPMMLEYMERIKDRTQQGILPTKKTDDPI